MKKMLLLSVAALTFGAAAPAFADHHDKAGKMFEKHDLNGDGVVTQEEFLEHAKKKFSEMDRDSNGEISQEEAKAQRDTMKEKMKEKREKWKEKYKEKMEENASPSTNE